MTEQQTFERIAEIAQKRSEPHAVIAQADAQRDFQEIARLSLDALTAMAKRVGG